MKVTFNQLFPEIDNDIDERIKAVFSQRFKMDHIYLTTSCSSALEMAAEILDIKDGDEVILPSFTYVTTAMSFVKRGAALIFADIDSQTFTIDLEDVAKKITDKTRVIIPVHYAGVSPDMDRLVEIIGNRKIEIVEDAAQGIDAKYKGRFLGSLGTIGVISLHQTKNISTGEGGILILNDPRLEAKANVIFEKGTDRHAFINGEIDRYSWVDFGGSYEMSDHLKMVLFDRLKKLDEIREERERVYQRYLEKLENVALQLPTIPECVVSNYHIFAVLMESEKVRNQVISGMNAKGIQTTFHYQPLHQSAFGKKQGYDRFELPITDYVAKRLLRLPIYPNLDNQTIDSIVCHLKNTLEEII
jgi:dTDP-4-amino-4,6-dideoxygalactose transaminase